MKRSRSAANVFRYHRGPKGRIIFAFQESLHFTPRECGHDHDYPLCDTPGMVSAKTWRSFLQNPYDWATLGQANIEHPGVIYYIPAVRAELSRLTWQAIYHRNLSKREEARKRILLAVIPRAKSRKSGGEIRRSKVPLTPLDHASAFDEVFMDVVTVRACFRGLGRDQQSTLRAFPQLLHLAELQGANQSKNFLRSSLLPERVESGGANTPQAVAAKILARETDYGWEEIKRVCAGRKRPSGLLPLPELTRQGKERAAAILKELGAAVRS